MPTQTPTATTSRALRAPTRAGAPLLGDAHRLLSSPLDALLDGWRECGDVVRFRVAPKQAYLVAHPDDIRRVLQGRDQYHRDRWHSAQLRRVSGNGLTASEGALWSEQRRLLRPAFTRERTTALFSSSVHATTRMLERWHLVARSGNSIDLHQEMLRLSLEILAESLFSADLEYESQAVVRDAARVLSHLYMRMRAPFPPLAWIASARPDGFRGARRALYELAEQLLRERAASEHAPHEPYGDLLGLLSEHANQADTAARRLARDQIVTMVLAGHDTTGAALAWAGQLVATHPEVDQRLHAEALERVGRGASLPYATMVFREALRLYPPAWVLSRTRSSADVIGGYAIAPRATVFVSPYVTHRHPDFWDSPEQFDPERFAGRSSVAHPYAYIPFGAGPRMCIGKALAEQTGQVVLALIARSYRLTPIDNRPLTPRARLTLQPSRPLLMRLVAR